MDDSTLSFDNMSEVHNSGGNYLWANRKDSAGGGMWDYPNWAFNNVETVSDQCWNARVAVCKQTYVGHTGAGELLGLACSGGASNNHDLNVQRGGNTAYRCLASGSEPNNLPIETDQYYVMWVR